MGKEVTGYLADDGTFFEREANCKRYECAKAIETLCESHGTNYENFMACINAWHNQIRGYLDADSNCIDKKANGQKPIFEGFGDTNEHDELSAFLQPEGDTANLASRDKESPGFLEQQIRGYK
jgi:hypothetical protein